MTTIVMQHKGVSYFKSDSYLMRGEALRRVIINGVAGAVVPCPGDAQWGMFDGEIKSITTPGAPYSKTIGYRLKDIYRDVTSFPRTLEANAFVWDEDEEDTVPAEIGALYKSDFYEAVSETITPEPVEIAFEVIARDCEPIARPDGVKTDFPASLREYPETWHKHPCSIDGDALFVLAVQRLKSAITGREHDFALTDYSSIGTVTLSRVMSHKPLEYTYNIGKKTKRASKTKSQFELFKLSKPRSSYTEGAIVPSRMEGKDWADLEPKITQFVSMILSYVQPESVCVCPQCDGNGFLVKATGT
jgi:hypothetical protein